MQFEIKVIPNSKRFAVKIRSNSYDTIITIYATERRVHNRVNVELVKEFTKLFNRRVYIKGGLQSQNKLVEVDGNEEEIFERLRAQCYV